MALGFELSDQLEPAGHAGFQHRRGVQGDVGPGGGVGGGGEVVGVGFAFHLEHRHGDLGGQLWLRGEPCAGSPALHHLLGVGVGFGQGQNIAVGVVHQEGAAQAGGGLAGDGGIGALQQLDQGAHVVATDHGGQQFYRLDRAQQGAGGSALGHPSQPAGFDIGRLIHPGGDPLREQVQQKACFASGGLLQQFREGLGLLGAEGQGGNP